MPEARPDGTIETGNEQIQLIGSAGQRGDRCLLREDCFRMNLKPIGPLAAIRTLRPRARPDSSFQTGLEQIDVLR